MPPFNNKSVILGFIGRYSRAFFFFSASKYNADPSLKTSGLSDLPVLIVSLLKLPNTLSSILFL